MAGVAKKGVGIGNPLQFQTLNNQPAPRNTVGVMRYTAEGVPTGYAPQDVGPARPMEPVERWKEDPDEVLRRRLSLLGINQTAVPRVKGGIDPSEAAAEAAIFARAKDRAGRLARAKANTLSHVMSDRGMLGSGVEAAGYGSIADDVVGQLGDINREMAIQSLNRRRAVADRDYAGDITQRAQDLSRLQSLLSLLNFKLY